MEKLLTAMKGKTRPKKMAKFQREAANAATRPMREAAASLGIRVLEVRKRCRRRKHDSDARKALFPEIEKMLEESARRQGQEVQATEIAHQANDLYIELSKIADKYPTKNKIRRFFELLARPDRVGPNITST